jgi:hypothetical protein
MSIDSRAYEHKTIHDVVVNQIAAIGRTPS